MSSLDASRTVWGTQAPKPGVGQSLVARATLCEYSAPTDELCQAFLQTGLKGQFLQYFNRCHSNPDLIPDQVAPSYSLGNKQLGHVEETWIWILTWISYFTSNSRIYLLWFLTKNSVSGGQELKAQRLCFNRSLFPISLKAKPWWAADSPAEL